MLRMAIWWRTRRSVVRRRRPVARPRSRVGSIIRQTTTAALRRPRLLIGILWWWPYPVRDLYERWATIVGATMVEISSSMRSINDRMRIHRGGVPRALQIDITQRQIRPRRHRSGRRCLRFQHQLFCNVLMPFHHLHIRLTWQTLLGQYTRKRRAVCWVGEVESLHRLLQEWHMLFWLQQQLDRLPSYEARGGQSGYCRGCIGIFFWLESVVAAERLVNEGERGLRGVEKERIVITADKTVEGCELGGRKGLDVPWGYVSVLHLRS